MRKYGLFPIVALLFLATMFALRPRIDGDKALTLQHSGIEPIRLADHLAREGNFASPFEQLNTGPSAHVAPGFPFLIASIIRVFGNGARGATVIWWLTAFVVALQLTLLPYLSLRMSMPSIAGLLAALVFLRSGFATPVWEINYVGLMLILLAFASFTPSSEPASVGRSIGIGILWGLLLLFSPVVILVFPVWLLWFQHYRNASRRSLALVTFITVLVVAPWLVRNYVVFHRFIFIRGNLGLELATSNNSCANFDLIRNLRSGCYVKNHPNGSVEQAALVRSLGEPEYNHRRLIDFLYWVRHNPTRYATLSAQRFAAFWFPWEPGTTLRSLTFGQVMTWILTALGFVGLRSLWKRNRPVCTYLLMWLTIFPLSYYLIVAFEERHRIPILWATFLPACDYFFRLVGGEWDSFLER